eukprot:scaffold322807_cov76-Cyclotella_meneghiniana.AAC.2
MARGDIRPPGVVVDGALPMVSIPFDLEDTLDPGWKGLKPSNSLFLLDNRSDDDCRLENMLFWTVFVGENAWIIVRRLINLPTNDVAALVDMVNNRYSANNTKQSKVLYQQQSSKKSDIFLNRNSQLALKSKSEIRQQLSAIASPSTEGQGGCYSHRSLIELYYPVVQDRVLFIFGGPGVGRGSKDSLSATELRAHLLLAGLLARR